MLEKMGNIMEETNVQQEVLPNIDLKNIITNLRLYNNDPVMLTALYTDILADDNVLYILTRVSQNMIFMEQFPEFYTKNKTGENIINCQQNSPYHRYGVFKHILYTIEHVGANNPKLNTSDIRLLKWTMFLHDIGKPIVKVTNEDGKDSFAGHEEMSVQIASDILDRYDFSDYEKKIILTLIKYHDKYLNEGEITYDNLKFLAMELDNRPDLFNLLIEVKIADNKAKSIDVYNKFMIVVKKYYEFANEYFTVEDYRNIEKQIDIETDLLNSETEQSTNQDSSIFNANEENTETAEKIEVQTPEIEIKLKNADEITNSDFESIYKAITIGKGLKYTFQPIITLNRNEIFGYEIKPFLEMGSGISIDKVLLKGKELQKYDRILQLLLINTLEAYSSLKTKTIGFLKVDLPSYETYVNKSRIFDVLDDVKIIMEFNNYMKYNTTQLKDIINNIRKKKGFVLIDNYGDNNLDIKSIDIINPDYIKYDLPKGEIDDITKKYIQELLTYCASSNTRLVINHINTEDQFEVIKECGADLVQGNFFAKPNIKIDFEQLNLKDEKIV